MSPIKKTFILILAAALISLAPEARAQTVVNVSGMPADVYYMMPEFADGMIFFRGQAPAQGKLNICALDNTLRFIDPSGKELAAADEEKIIKVRIDTVFFIRSGGVYYRMYPVSRDMGIALKRDVQIQKDAKQGAYGMTDRTSSIRESSSIYVDGISYSLDKVKDYPYNVKDVLLLYKGDEVYVFNKRNLRKLFPEKKAGLDDYFKSGGTIPDTLPEALEFLERWK